MLVDTQLPLMIKLETVRFATDEDPTLNLVKRFIHGKAKHDTRIKNI